MVEVGFDKLYYKDGEFHGRDEKRLPQLKSRMWKKYIIELKWFTLILSRFLK